MKEKFTPGPWKVGEEKKPMYAWRGQIIGNHPDDGEEFILASCNNNYPEMAIVNARLIAAAPDMYEALKAVLDDVQFMIEDGYIGDVMDDILYVHARAALAKAESAS